MAGKETYAILVTFGGLFLLGLLADLVGRRTALPRVTLLLVAGFLVGSSVLDWLHPATDAWFPVLTNVALTMIGFLLGARLTRRALRDLGPSVLYISGGVVLTTTVVVSGSLALLGVPLEIALLLGGIATATAPAATLDTVREASASGRFTDTLLGIVAVDDAWGLVVFSVLLAATQLAVGDGAFTAILLDGLWEVLGAAALGVIIGLPMSFLTGRLTEGEPTQAEALGFILLCAGLSIWAGVSHILAAMVMGATVANLASHHERPFHEIEGIEWPFLMLFFLLSGARLDIDALLQVGALGAGFIALRVVSRIVGAQVGGRLCRAEPSIRRWMGIALLPQAGVALGMALVAVQVFPQHEDVILPVVLGATVVFELAGPVATRWALIRVGDAARRSWRDGGP